MLTDLKKSDDFVFLKVVDSIALQQSLRDLDRGFENFRKYFPEVEQPEEKTVHTFVYASDIKRIFGREPEEMVIEIEIERLWDFKNHPFKILLYYLILLSNNSFLYL